jgi:hypothetical protein
MKFRLRLSALFVLSLAAPSLHAEDAPLRIAVFKADATPALGTPVAYAPVRSITDPLSARGIVLLGSGKPIVLCAVDWIGIGNTGNDEWRKGLAEAAGTTMDRVTVHTLHQHDGPRCDFSAEELLAAHGLGGTKFDSEFCRRTIAGAASAIREALPKARTVTHLGVGMATVEKVASNRRILGANGKVAIGRMSASKNPAAQAAPEGTIDPILKLISFWDGETPLVCLTYYATHPQSYYGHGDVTAEFVGLARAQRERDMDGLPHIHFNGASGNVAAGKYNDGSPAARVVLTQRMAEGMKKAWEATKKTPIHAADLDWRVLPVSLPLGPHLVRATLEQTLASDKADPRDRLNSAIKLALLTRSENGHQFELTRLRLGTVNILHMPGELFVEYQLAAQQMRPQETVCMAAYGDYGPGYIGTEIAYTQGGYEVGPNSSNTAPAVERVLMDAMKHLLSDSP